jgi:ABC-type dipeptide/oligopeptide/nickel transport system permease subunit
MVGLVMLTLVILLAVLGPMLASRDPNAPMGLPGAPPSAGAPLGLDFLGRDVLARVLHGGISVLLIGSVGTLLAYGAGVSIGLLAGHGRSFVDPLLMRTVDLLLVFPPLLLLLLLIAGLGAGVVTLLIGIVLVQLPWIARLVRTATLEVSTRGYVRAAVARGERTPAVLGREILPNIVASIMASAGLGFAYSVLMVASVNFLGLGLKPPTSDWGLMLSENRPILDTNPWSVLAPAVLLGCLIISVNLIADAYWQTVGSSIPMRRRRGPVPDLTHEDPRLAVESPTTSE